MSATILTLSPELERLIDERLDAVDRILSLSRTARSERMQILSDLESQIRDRLATKTTEEPTRADLLAVFAELDPPEAYLDEGVSKSPTFRTSGFATGGNQRVAGDALATRFPTSHGEKGKLALWAGFIVSVGCILASSWMFIMCVGVVPVSILADSRLFESVIVFLNIVVQLFILCGCLVAVINLAKFSQKSELNQLISWACIGAIPLTVSSAIGWFAMWFKSSEGTLGPTLQVFCIYGLPCGELIHGIWLGFFTFRYMRKCQEARSDHFETTQC